MKKYRYTKQNMSAMQKLWYRKWVHYIFTCTFLNNERTHYLPSFCQAEPIHIDFKNYLILKKPVSLERFRYFVMYCNVIMNLFKSSGRYTDILFVIICFIVLLCIHLVTNMCIHCALQISSHAVDYGLRVNKVLSYLNWLVWSKRVSDI